MKKEFWRNKLSNKEALNFTLDWYSKYYSLNAKLKSNRIDFTLSQIKYYFTKCKL